MASIIFSAFALEAYLNHLGKKIYTKKEWEIFERIKPLDKLDLISEKFNIDLNKGSRPFQTIKAVFKFRKTLIAYAPKISYNLLK